MTYDPIDTNNDGIVDADVDNTTVGTGTVNLGSNYTLEENQNGNLLIKDSGGTIILKHTDGGDFALGQAGLELGDLLDGSTGATVYDGSTETLGDGTQTVDANSVSTGDATITDATVGNFTNSPTGKYGKTISAPTPTAYVSGPAHGEGGSAFRGATLAPDGRVIFAPFDSSNVGIVSQLLDIATANTANR
jgi:hypothetical protein